MISSSNQYCLTL